MKTRTATPEDMAQIIELAEKHGLSIPKEGTIIVAESNSGKIEAFANIRFVAMLSPFVTEKPIYGYRLWEHIEKKSKEKGIKLMQCYVEQKNKKILEKLGFKRVFPKHLIMEKFFVK